jgi:hypothetical protein
MQMPYMAVRKQAPAFAARLYCIALYAQQNLLLLLLLPSSSSSSSFPSFPPQAQLASSMWLGSGYFSILPWSCCVLKSVPEVDIAALRCKPKM